MDQPLRGEDSEPWWGGWGGPSAPATPGPLEGVGLPWGWGEGGERGERSELARRGRAFTLIRPSRDLFFPL